jgi:glutamate N-acetyltransferase/amino-acid N-acetyltransferase
MQPVKGFRWAGVSCGLKKDGALDLALIVSDTPCAVAGTFTTNRVKAAPVLWDRDIVQAGRPVRAVVANAGSANACTGTQGLADARAMADRAAQAIGCAPEEVLVLSTGVIGVPLPIDIVLPGIDAAARALRSDGWDAAAHAIMTTDTRPKIASRQVDGGTIVGIAKGAGMIAPNMATMLSVVVTDAHALHLQDLLDRAVGGSFNRIVVDGDMSTNDSVLLLANGASGVDTAIEDALAAVCVDLATGIVRDGEGATKLVTVAVEGAAGETDARAVAQAIATSPLCKTAFYGADPNWGRFVCAAGYAGVDLDPDHLKLWLEKDGASLLLFEDGLPAHYDEAAAQALMQTDVWTVRLDLGMGAASSWVWTCDLSHEYVTINGHYRT